MSAAIERVARAMARSRWGGVKNEADLARMVEHGWRDFVIEARIGMRETLALVEEEAMPDSVVARRVRDFRGRHGLDD